MGYVIAVSRSDAHTFSKTPQASIELVPGLGVEGDAHAGATVQHLHHMRQDPQRPNLRQVHLVHAELFDLLQERGFAIEPGALGENITTRGTDLLGLSTDSHLVIGGARLRVTGLRNPCVQIERFRTGLLAELIVDKTAKRFLAGVMSVVEEGGTVRPGDAVTVVPAPGPFRPLAPV